MIEITPTTIRRGMMIQDKMPAIADSYGVKLFNLAYKVLRRQTDTVKDGNVIAFYGALQQTIEPLKGPERERYLSGLYAWWKNFWLPKNKGRKNGARRHKVSPALIRRVTKEIGEKNDGNT